MASALQEEGRRIIALLTDGRAAMAALALTFLLEVLIGLRVYVASMDILSYLLLALPMTAEGLLWLAAVMIASGSAYYSASDGKGALPSLADAAFKMVRFNYPRQLLWLGGLLLSFSLGAAADRPWETWAINAALIAALVLAFNLVLAAIFGLLGLGAARLRRRPGA